MPSLIEKAKQLSKEDFTSLPIIDLTDATSPDPAKRKALAMEIQHAALTAGFFYVKNHGVPEDLIQKTFDQSKNFFDLPSETKKIVDITSKSDNFRGWVDLLAENNDPKNAGDLHEAFNVGLDPAILPQVPSIISSNSTFLTSPDPSSSTIKPTRPSAKPLHTLSQSQIDSGYGSASGTDIPTFSSVHRGGVNKDDMNAVLDAGFARAESEARAQEVEALGQDRMISEMEHGLEGSVGAAVGRGIGAGIDGQGGDGMIGAGEGNVDGDLKFGGNLWLDEGVWEGAGEFKETVLQYYSEVLGLGYRLYPLLALALDMPEDFFADKTRHPAVVQRLLYYPPLKGQPCNESQTGIGEHTDFEVFTILRQDEVGGLEVKNVAGDWVKAEYVQGTFVVNIGDQLARWTNDIFKSTRHRAIPPPAFKARYSMPSFFGCDHHVPLEPIATCVSEERPPKYEVVTAGAYVYGRMQETYVTGDTLMRTDVARELSVV